MVEIRKLSILRAEMSGVLYPNVTCTRSLGQHILL